MRIAFAINGTRGDVQPALVLAHALTERGHHVRIGVPPNMVTFARQCGVDTVTLGHDTREHMAQVRRIRAAAGRNPIRRLRAVLATRDAGWAEMVADIGAVTEGADVLVTGFVTEQIALAYADARRIPLVSLHHAPVRPNRSVGPMPGLPLGDGPRSIRAQWAVVETLMSTLTRRRENRLRSALGCPPARGSLFARLRRTPGVEIQAYDPLFCLDSDALWRKHSRTRHRPVTGFIGLPEALRNRLTNTRADRELDAWLAAGDPPVYVGFGSMPLRDPDALHAAVRGVAQELDVRILVCLGWNDVSDGPSLTSTDRIRFESAVDHHAVFSRCAAIVHHGGAGTSAAALRAGRPSVICWYGSDQPFWGERFEHLGIGVSMPASRLDAGTLTAAVRTALSPELRRRALDSANTMTGNTEAITRAVELIEEATQSGHPLDRPTTRRLRLVA